MRLTNRGRDSAIHVFLAGMYLTDKRFDVQIEDVDHNEIGKWDDAAWENLSKKYWYTIHLFRNGAKTSFIPEIEDPDKVVVIVENSYGYFSLVTGERTFILDKIEDMYVKYGIAVFLDEIESVSDDDFSFEDTWCNQFFMCIFYNPVILNACN